MWTSIGQMVVVVVAAATTTSLVAAQQNAFIATDSIAGLDMTTLDPSEIDSLLSAYPDPVDFYKKLRPDESDFLDEPRLLKYRGDRDVNAFWATEGDKMRLFKQHIAFVDLTGSQLQPDSFHEAVKDDYVWPNITHQSIVSLVFEKLSTDSMKYHLETLSSFWTRNYRTEYGAASSKWIFNTLAEIISNAPPSSLISLRTFPHEFAQSSIIARFEAQTSNRSHPVVVIGAHQDSMNYKFPLLRSPGADDDGSGTVTIMEAFKALVESDFKPKIPVEFHWFAAEEGGLLGSRDVVKNMIASQTPVKAMIQFDMTMYLTGTEAPKLTIIDTSVTPSLCNFTHSLGEVYSDLEVVFGQLPPRAGSDHMSFCDGGYPCSFAVEGDPARGQMQDFYTHTPLDDGVYPKHASERQGPSTESFSYDHGKEYAKLAVAFAIELGGWVNK